MNQANILPYKCYTSCLLLPPWTKLAGAQEEVAPAAGAPPISAEKKNRWGAVREEPEGGGNGARAEGNGGRADGRRRSTQPEKKAGAAGGQGHLSRRRSRVLGRRREKHREERAKGCGSGTRGERSGAGRGERILRRCRAFPLDIRLKFFGRSDLGLDIEPECLAPIS
jgi:hypothetical protein